MNRAFAPSILLLAAAGLFSCSPERSTQAPPQAQAEASNPIQAAGHPAPAQPTPPFIPETTTRKNLAVYFSVGQGDRPFDWELQRKTCRYLYRVTRAAIQQARDSEGVPSQLESSCLSLSPDSGAAIPPEQEMESARASLDFDYHIQLVTLASGQWKLRIENWRALDAADPVASEWTIKATKRQGLLNVSDEEKKSLIEGRIQTFFAYALNEKAFKDYFLEKAVRDSKTVDINAAGNYTDRTQPSRPEIPFEEAYARYLGESPKNGHLLRAATEISAFLGFGAVFYLIKGGAHGNNIQRPTAWEGIQSKFTSFDLYRADNNSLYFNALHAVSGLWFYGAARGSDYGHFESFLFTLAASSMWEYIVEAREVMSIPDQIATGYGGTILGSVVHEFGKFFARSDDNVVTKTLRTIFGSPEAFNRALYHNGPPKAEELDRWGFPTDVWHQFSLEVATRADGTAGNLSASGKLIPIAEYMKEGEFSKFLTDAPYSELGLEATLGPEGMGYFRFFVKNALLAYFKQNLKMTQGKDLQGYSFFIGLSSGFEVETNLIDELPGQPGGIFHDHWASIHVLGTTLDVTAQIQGTTVHAIVDVFGDLAQIRAIALDQYKATRPWDGVKSILRKRGDYYGYGLAGQSKLIVSRGRVEVAAELRYINLNSIEGIDQEQSTLTNDFHSKDIRVTRTYSTSYALVKDQILLQLVYRDRTFSGWMQDVFERKRKSELFIGLRFLF